MQSNHETPAPYSKLIPDTVLSAVESQGWRCDGRLLALNSYENRVYQIGIEEPVSDQGGEIRGLVAKFYRPGRWSTEAILEEHSFALELAGQEIPVVAPITHDAQHSDQNQDNTLHTWQGYRFALFPRRGGRWPELNSSEDRQWVGRFLGRIHAVGAAGQFHHRPRLDVEGFVRKPAAYLLQHDFIPDYLRPAYSTLIEDLLIRIDAAYQRAGPLPGLRLHGDCHRGNILWTEAGPHFVDLDDCRTGPAIQDLWMLLDGEREDMTRQLADILEGYTQFHHFDPRQLNLIEALRTLRMVHYAGWLAKRWNDPAFPLAFPWFNTTRYWEEHVLSLREQAALLDEPPLELPY